RCVKAKGEVTEGVSFPHQILSVHQVAGTCETGQAETQCEGSPPECPARPGGTVSKCFLETNLRHTPHHLPSHHEPFIVSYAFTRAGQLTFVSGHHHHLCEDAVSTLRSAGLRVTEQRRAILRTLADADGPLAADEAHEALGPGICDLVTVYRSLESFEKAGAVQRGVRENGKKIYCLAHGTDHHHHLTCRRCGRTERIDVCVEADLEKLADTRGFSEVPHILEVYGTCSACREGR
ncbi:uncharacterized protein METZ01_LOCUS498957, partial [marine metagenome]